MKRLSSVTSTQAKAIFGYPLLDYHMLNLGDKDFKASIIIVFKYIKENILTINEQIEILAEEEKV